MKKFLIVLVVLIAVALASFLWLRSQMGITDPARLLPGNTLAFLTFPDLPRTLLRWPSTALARIAGESEVAAFLEKPLGFLGKNRGGDEAGRVLTALKPGRIMVALVPGSGRPRVLVGFQYWGSHKDFEDAITRLREEMTGDKPGAAQIEKSGDLQWSSAPTDRGVLHWGTTGRWGFLSNDSKALEDALKRGAGRPSDQPTLAESEDFLSCRATGVADPDLFVFVRPEPLLDSVLEEASAMDFRPIPAQVEGIRRVRAAAYGLRAEGTVLRESLFILRPEPPEPGPLAHLGMPFAGADTLAYFDARMRMENLASLLGSFSAPGGATAEETQALAARLPAALDGQISVVIGWPQGAARPSAFTFLGVKDRMAARDLLLQAATLHAPEVQISEEGGSEIFDFPGMESPFFAPALALNERMLVAALDRSELRNLLASPPPASLQSTPAFAGALTAFQTANESFGFVDLRGLFERLYPLARQILVFSTALMPGMSEIMDPAKLPQTETISKHLGPVVFSQSRRSDGYFLESSGPITMLQAAALLTASGSGFLRNTESAR